MPAGHVANVVLWNVVQALLRLSLHSKHVSHKDAEKENGPQSKLLDVIQWRSESHITYKGPHEQHSL